MTAGHIFLSLLGLGLFWFTLAALLALGIGRAVHLADEQPVCITPEDWDAHVQDALDLTANGEWHRPPEFDFALWDEEMQT